MIPRAFALRTLRVTSPLTPTSQRINTLIRPCIHPRPHIRSASHTTKPPLPRIRMGGATSDPHSVEATADAKIDEITELFATAQDEFEIAMEETEKVSVYAEEDRKAAWDELAKVQEAYRNVVEGPDEQLAERVKTRIGQRVRELEQGVKAMEEMAQNQD